MSLGPVRHKVSEAVLDVAALAYDVSAEFSNPAPDSVMRRIVLDRLNAAVQALTIEERKMLAARAGR